MSRRPDVIQHTLLQNPGFQNTLPDSVICNTLELATAWIDGYADLFLFQRVSPSGKTYGEIRDNFKLGGWPTGTSSVFPPQFSTSAVRLGMSSSATPGMFGAMGARPPAPTSSQEASSSSASYPSSGSTNLDGYAGQASLSDLYGEPMQPPIHPSEDESWDYIHCELDRVYQLDSMLNGQSDSEEDTPSDQHETGEADSGSGLHPHALPWSRVAADPM